MEGTTESVNHSAPSSVRSSIELAGPSPWYRSSPACCGQRLRAQSERRAGCSVRTRRESENTKCEHEESVRVCARSPCSAREAFLFLHSRSSARSRIHARTSVHDSKSSFFSFLFIPQFPSYHVRTPSYRTKIRLLCRLRREAICVCTSFILQTNKTNKFSTHVSLHAYTYGCTNDQFWS